MVIPAAVLNAPGANIVRKDALLEKQVILSGEVELSVQVPPPHVTPPTLASYTAPTDTTPGVHAGIPIAFVTASFPDAATVRIPFALALSILA
jgi:hypothetical protein